jgi:hypothetical protein
MTTDPFVVVKSRSRTYGFAIQAPASVAWAIGPGHTFGWYRRRSDAQERADVHNRWLPITRGSTRSTNREP